MKILIVDDHALIRDALKGVLSELDSDVAILEAAGAKKAVGQLAGHPDLELILLDLRLPDRNGLEVLAELRQTHPDVAIVMLSASNDRDDITKALDLGALGFIPKSAPREVIMGALRLILSGGVYVPPEVLGRTLGTDADLVGPAADSPRAAALGLTERQRNVLALMMRGKSNKAICRALDLAEPTVKNHVSAILKALQVKNRTEAVIAATSLGFSAAREDGTAVPSRLGFPPHSRRSA